MWLLVAREPKHDAPQWPGRTSLAALDAVAWPLAAVLLIHLRNLPLGVVSPVVIVTALALSVVRLRRAIWLNHCYSFTTWRWGGVVLGLVMVGFALRLTG